MAYKIFQKSNSTCKNITYEKKNIHSSTLTQTPNEARSIKPHTTHTLLKHHFKMQKPQKATDKKKIENRRKFGGPFSCERLPRRLVKIYEAFERLIHRLLVWQREPFAILAIEPSAWFLPFWP